MAASLNIKYAIEDTYDNRYLRGFAWDKPLFTKSLRQARKYKSGYEASVVAIGLRFCYIKNRISYAFIVKELGVDDG